jgi:hypothetical protein
VDLPAYTLSVLRTLAYVGLIMWVLVVLLLLIGWRLKRSGISWLQKWALGAGKLTKERIKKSGATLLELDRGFIKWSQGLLIMALILTPFWFLYFPSPLKLVLLLSYITWVLMPFCFLCHLLLRTDRLFLKQLERMVVENQGEGELGT